MYKWLSASVLKMTAEKVWRLRAEGRYTFQAKNDSQSYNAITLSVVYARYILNRSNPHLSASVLKMTAEKVWRLRAEGRDTFQAKNDSQSYNAVTLSIVYAEVYIEQI
ncbi:Peroxisomal acyl-CoA oxidase 3 [Operophtera brumata]|uniref:Peroxisomal acyl-CoA oxidase 3 n=1 Tax=Operophtera brumata TaxID=104452 RepID=A0A0L7KH64_OPEBR|nr:Peroxisomal acyl-CoA oxidase 3 [Operophtera brumata]